MSINARPEFDELALFARGVAHDFNNTLTAILGHGELLRMFVKDERCQQDLTNLLEGGDKARKLVARVQQLGRARSSRPSPPDAPADLRALLAAWREDDREAPAGVQIVWPDATTLPPAPVAARPDHLRCVFEELLRNAIDAIVDPPGTVTIELESSPDTVTLRISDTAGGLPDALRTTAMLPFVTTKSGVEGAGLGLPIALGYVRQHSGTLELIKSAGGTTARVEFPRAAEPAGP